MLSKSVTAQLMGDPDPFRFQRSEALKERVKWSPGPQIQVRHRKHLTGKERVLQAVLAVSKGAKTTDMISASAGISQDMTNNYLKRAVQWGWIDRTMQPNHKSGGRGYVYSLTKEGRAELERSK